MTLLKPVGSWPGFFGYNEIQEFFCQVLPTFSLGMIHICFHRIKVSALLVCYSRVSLLWGCLHCPCTVHTLLGLHLAFYLSYLHARADSDHGGLTGGLPITSELELSMCFSRVSDMRYLLCSSGRCCIFGILVGMREQLQCADPSCEQSRGAGKAAASTLLLAERSLVELPRQPHLKWME